MIRRAAMRERRGEGAGGERERMRWVAAASAGAASAAMLLCCAEDVRTNCRATCRTYEVGACTREIIHDVCSVAQIDSARAVSAQNEQRRRPGIDWTRRVGSARGVCGDRVRCVCALRVCALVRGARARTHQGQAWTLGPPQLLPSHQPHPCRSRHCPLWSHRRGCGAQSCLGSSPV